MKKHVSVFIFALAIFLIVRIAQAQAPNFVWAKKAGGSGFDAGQAIAPEVFGQYSFAIGLFSDTASFGDTILSSSGNYDIFLVRFDRAGNVAWARKAGGPERDEGYDLVLTPDVYLIATGAFTNRAVFGSQTLISRGGSDIFVAQYDTVGNLVWTASMGGSGEDEGRSIAVDRQDNIYVAGSFQGLAIFGTDTLTTTGIRDFFLAKFDQFGNYLWAVAGAATGEDWATSVAVDDNGNCFITGAFAGEINFGGRAFHSLGFLDAFVAKYDPNGNVLWAQSTGVSHAGIGASIAVDQSGHCMVAGQFRGFATIGVTDTLFSATPDSSDIFLAKFDSTGRALWSRQAGGFGHDEGKAVLTAPNGDLVVGGFFSDEADFGATHVRGAGGYDLFVARYDASGTLLWLKTAGGASSEYLADMSQDLFGEYYLTGAFGGTARLDNFELSSVGYDDIWVAKLGQVQPPVAEIKLELPEIDARPGDTVLVNLFVDFPADSSFSSVDLRVSSYHYREHLDLIAVITDSSLIGEAGWTLEYNEMDTFLVIAAAGANDIRGEGVLLQLQFAVRDTVVGFAPLVIASAIFNTGTIPVKLTPGGVNVIYTPVYGDVDRNHFIQAFDASRILKYLVGLVNLNPLQRLNADVSLDKTVSALDAALILQYLVGLIDRLPYPSTGTQYSAAADISMTDATIRAGQTMEVPIRLARGKNVLSFEGRITFDPAHLQFLSINTQDLLANFTVETKAVGGTIRIAGAGKLPEGQAGTFLKLKFIASEQFTDEQTTIRFESVRWNEGPVLENVAAANIKNMTVGISEPQSAIPKQFSLAQNYPNPITTGAKLGSLGNASTTIQFALPQRAEVKISIYNLAGQVVAVLLQRRMEPGYHTVHWDATSAGAGIYLVKMQAGEFSGTKKILILK